MKGRWEKTIIPAIVSVIVTVAANAAVVTKDMVMECGMQASNAKPAIDRALAAAKTYLTDNPSDEVVLDFPAGTWNVLNPSSAGIYINMIFEAFNA